MAERLTEPEAAPPASGWSRRVIGPFTLRHIVVLGGVLAAAALLLVVLGAPLGSPTSAGRIAPSSDFYQVGEPTRALFVGQRAPELVGVMEDGGAQPLLDLEGRPLRLADRRGHPIWLSFFATWCPPCQEEMPVLREAYDRYTDEGLEMVAVSVQETTAEDVAAYAATYALPYDIGFDATSGVFHAYAGFGLPTHVIIDGGGIIRHIRYGPFSLDELASVVEPLLDEASSGRPPASPAPTAGHPAPTSVATAGA